MDEQARVKYVRLTNKGAAQFSDRHDGVPYRIAAGEAKNLPLDVAAHIFGWSPTATREAMFRHVCKRQGWNTLEMVKPDPELGGKTRAEHNFEGLLIESVMYRLVEVEGEPKAAIPADTRLDEVEPATIPPAPPRRLDVRA